MTGDAAPAVERGRPTPGALDRPEAAFARAARLPVVWIVALIGVSTIVRSAIGLGVPSPWILPDEIVYSELAKSIAAGDRPSIRGVPTFGWGEVYPTLIAPAWIVFDDPVRAYRAALAINALVMSLVAVPAYLLARLFVSRKASVLVAAFALLVPSMTYTGVLMTENAFYPVFVLAVLLVARAVRSPTIGAQAAALLGLGLVAFTRIQGLALVGAYAGAVVLYALTGSRTDRGSYVRRFVPSVALALAASAAPIALSIARGDGPFGWLGARSGTFDVVRPGEVPKWFAYLAADLLLYVAVVPVVSAAVVVGLGLSRRAPERVRLFAAVALPVAAAMLASVALVSSTFDVDGGESINERYVFYVVPLAFAGLALWVESGLPRPRPWVGAVLAVGCLLPVLVPIGRYEYTAEFQSLALLSWQTLPVSGLALAACVAAFTLACAALWTTCRRETVGRLWLLAGATMVIAGAIASLAHAERAANSATPVSVGPATWVDDAVPPGARVAVVWDERRVRGETLDRFYPWIMIAEFFNPDLGEVYRLGPRTYYERFLSTVPVRLRADGGIVLPDGMPIAADYVLTTCRTRVDGMVVARSVSDSLVLAAVRGTVRVAAGPTCRKTAP